jgi:heme A synthase
MDTKNTVDTRAQGLAARFYPLAMATAALTFGLIVFGAVVRVTESGLGCGNHWPLCNGTIFPPLDNITAWIEWLHRLFALLIGALGLGMLALAIVAYRKDNRVVMQATAGGALLFFIQSMLGALVVVLDLPPTFVTLHLGTAMLLLAALVVAGIAAVHRVTPQQADGVTWLIYANTILSLVIILSGALVRGAGANLACADWPLCNGAVFPFGQGQLAVVHMTHRVAVLALGITLVLMAWQVWRNRTGRARVLALAALIAFFSQAGVGAMYVFSAAAGLWGALHVAGSAATWALLVWLSAIEAINTHPEWIQKSKEKTENAWSPQSKPI